MLTLRQLYPLQDLRHQGADARHQLADTSRWRGSQVLLDLTKLPEPGYFELWFMKTLRENKDRLYICIYRGYHGIMEDNNNTATVMY